MRAVIYRRISNDVTGEAAGIGRQAEDCHQFCTQRGWRIVGDFEDNDISASRFSKKRRPGYLAALDMIETGQADALVAWHLDRLWRRPSELEHLIELAEKQQITVATLNGDIDISNADGRFAARILVTVAAKASDDASVRLRRKELAEAAAGRPHGPRAFGFAADRKTADPAEAAIVNELATRIVAGDGVRTLARELTARRVPTPQRAAHWSDQAIRHMLCSPRMIGARTHHGVITKTGAFDQILTPHLWQQVKTVLEVQTYRDPPRRRLLTRLAFCDRCGTQLNYSQRALICPSPLNRPPGCGKLSAAIGPVERIVTAAVWTASDLNQIPDITVPPSADTARVAALEARKNELYDMFTDGALTRLEWERSKQRLEGRLAEFRKLVRAAAGQRAAGEWTGKTGALATVWPTLSVDRQRAALSAFIDRVVIAPTDRRGCKFDEARIRIVWR